MWGGFSINISKKAVHRGMENYLDIFNIPAFKLCFYLRNTSSYLIFIYLQKFLFFREIYPKKKNYHLRAIVFSLQFKTTVTRVVLEIVILVFWLRNKTSYDFCVHPKQTLKQGGDCKWHIWQQSYEVHDHNGVKRGRL